MQDDQHQLGWGRVSEQMAPADWREWPEPYASHAQKTP